MKRKKRNPNRRWPIWPISRAPPPPLPLFSLTGGAYLAPSYSSRHARATLPPGASRLTPPEPTRLPALETTTPLPFHSPLHSLSIDGETGAINGHRPSPTTPSIKASPVELASSPHPSSPSPSLSLSLARVLA